MKQTLIWTATILTASGLMSLLTVNEAFAQDRTTKETPTAGSVLPVPPAPFKGTINLRAKDSVSDFPQPAKAPKDAPNILLVLLDDVGFGATSTFGGPCATPTFDKLAASGLKYNQFHTTALCSPTRAALVTGRNHHSVHTAGIMGWDNVREETFARQKKMGVIPVDTSQSYTRIRVHLKINKSAIDFQAAEILGKF